MDAPLRGPIPNGIWLDGCTQLQASKSFFEDREHNSLVICPIITPLELLDRACDTLSTSLSNTLPTQELSNFTTFLKELDWEISNKVILAMNYNSSETTTLVLLFHIAILVYLYRVAGDFLHSGSKIQQKIDDAFDLLSRLGSCERQFPVFVLGCEARTDEQRAIILDLISRTESKPSSRSCNHLKIMLHAIWAQDDLADGPLNYWDKLSLIISGCIIVPSLV